MHVQRDVATIRQSRIRSVSTLWQESHGNDTSMYAYEINLNQYIAFYGF